MRSSGRSRFAVAPLNAGVSLPKHERAALKLFALLVGLVASVGCANAAEEPKEEKRFVQTPLGLFLMVEAGIAVNAGLATLDPDVYGIVGALVFPLAAGGEGTTSKTMKWAGLALAEGLAAYHIAALDKDDDSDKDTYLKSTAAWHVFGGALLATAWLTGDLEEKKAEPAKASFRFTPTNGGAVLVVGYAF